jgi:hypothetical protein
VRFKFLRGETQVGRDEEEAGGSCMNPGQASGWEHKVVARDRQESPEDGVGLGFSGQR